MRLRDRCKAFLSTAQANRIMRQGDPVEELVAFVTSETGRTADKALDKALPLVLYFKTDADRDEFIAAVHEAKPDMIARKLP